MSIISTLALLPVLMRVLDREELGIWMVLADSQVFLNVLGLGIAPTLTRHIALAKGRSGADPNVPLNTETERHIADLVTTGRIALRGLAVLTFLVALGGGVIFWDAVALQGVAPSRLYTAWVLMCAGYSIGVWVSYLECWMAGIGHIGWSALITTIIALATVGANIAVALLGGGIVSLACVAVISGILQRALLIVLLRRRAPALFRARGQWNWEYARKLVRPSLLTWVNSLGAFLVLQTDAFFIAKFRGAAELPPFKAAYQIVNNLQVLAVSFALSAAPLLSQAWQAGEHASVRIQTIRFSQIGMVIMGAGVGFLLTSGRDFIELLLGPDSFVGYSIIVMFCVLFTLEAQHVALVVCSRATEDERYAISGIAGGLLNLWLTWRLIGPLGLFGVALGTVIAQALTNNWYCVYRPLTRLKIQYIDYLASVTLLWAISLCGTLLVNTFVLGRLRELGFGRIWLTLAVAATTGGVLLSALWWGVLNRSQRQRMLQLVRHPISRS